VSETVVVTPASSTYETVPAVYETIQEPVIVQEASTDLVTIPATYETVSETVVLAQSLSLSLLNMARHLRQL